MKQTTEIEIEFSETVAYGNRRMTRDTNCPQCGSVVEMSTPQVAAIIAGSNDREIYRLIEADKVHFVEADTVLICLRSLTETLTKPPARTAA